MVRLYLSHNVSKECVYLMKEKSLYANKQMEDIDEEISKMLRFSLVSSTKKI